MKDLLCSTPLHPRLDGARWLASMHFPSASYTAASPLTSLHDSEFRQKLRASNHIFAVSLTGSFVASWIILGPENLLLYRAVCSFLWSRTSPFQPTGTNASLCTYTEVAVLSPGGSLKAVLWAFEGCSSSSLECFISVKASPPLAHSFSTLLSWPPFP